MDRKIQNCGDAEAKGGNNIAFRTTYSALAEVIEGMFRTFQVSQQALVRLLLTLSSGSLLASISLLRSSVTTDTVWLVLLPLAWSLFGISVVFCLLYYGTFTGYGWIAAALKNFMDEAEELTAGSSLSLSERAAAAIKIRLEQLTKDQENLKEIDRKVMIAMGSFLFGFLALTVFATRNLPWGP